MEKKRREGTYSGYAALKKPCKVMKAFALSLSPALDKYL